MCEEDTEYPEHKEYTDEELFSDLENDGIKVAEEDVQKAREDDGETLFDIGYEYYSSKQDDNKAFAWFYKAALQNYHPAQAQVGVMYHRGKSVNIDFRLAKEWYQKAAFNGNSTAEFNIGVIYQNGDGITPNYRKAMEWYMKAAKNGDDDAMNSIGFLYHKGLGLRPNYLAAIEWYIKAIDNGNELALFNLGFIYEKKAEVRDLQKAINWYQKSADNNYEGAEIAVERLNQQGYYAEKEEEKEIHTENTVTGNNNNDVISNNTNNDQNQLFSSEIDSDQDISKLDDDKMERNRINSNSLLILPKEILSIRCKYSKSK